MVSLRLTYNLTQPFSLKLTIIGVVILTAACIAVGVATLLIKGKVLPCDSREGEVFLGPLCQPSSVSIGETFIMPNFNYAVASNFNYSGQNFSCSVEERGLSIYLTSVLAPQFVWSYRIGCNIDNTRAFNLTIVGGTSFNGSSSGSRVEQNITAVVRNSTADLTACNSTVTGPIVVLRYSGGQAKTKPAHNEAYTQTSACNGLQFLSSSPFQSIATIVDDAIEEDLGQDVTIRRLYLCSACTEKFDKPSKLILEVLQGIGSLFGIIYTLVIFTLAIFSRDDVTRSLMYMKGTELGDRSMGGVNP